MKFLNLLFFLIVSNISLAQNANVYISNFDVENSALKNGKIQYFNSTGDTSYNFRFIIGRNFATTPMPAIRITAIAVFDNYGTEYAASDSLYFTQSDFSAFNGTETQIISKKFTLKSNKKVGSLKLKYRFLVSYPGYSGWTNWFYSNKTFQTQQYEPVIPNPTFTGPSSICTDGTYTITNPGTITLENASGIATLTSLGNNQWKVTRIGNNSGSVTLKSISATNVISTFAINVGGDFSFTGRPIVNPGQIYTYTVDASVNNVSFSVGGADIISQTSNTVRIRILNVAANGALPYVYISATGTGSCGEITKTITPDVVIY